jgi:hypothetical protein
MFHAGMFHAGQSGGVATESKASLLSRMLTAEQVVEQLGGLVTPRLLHRWAREGKLPGSITIGRHRWFDHRTASWLIRPDGLPSKVMGQNGAA